MNQKSEKIVSRRQLLEGAGILGGALILGRVARADDDDDDKKDDNIKPAILAEGDFVLKLSDAPELGKVGGFKIVEIAGDSVIIARTPDGLIANSAICTHKGCEVGYSLEERQYVCPCHKAHYDESGKVVRGPAKLPLAPYNAVEALIVSKKI